MSSVPVTGLPAPGGGLGVFRSWLPAGSSRDWASPEALANEAGGTAARGDTLVRVLVADDNPVNLAMMFAQMASRGLVPMLAADGAEAVALACQRQFDLILMDLQMPVLDGLDATSAIRRFEAACSRGAVPVLAYSSRMPGAGLLATHGLNGSLSKPCGEQELDDCLVRWCPRYRPAAAPRWAGPLAPRSN